VNLNGTSEETLDLIRKAQTAGVTSSTGIVGVDLGDLISLIPVNTPFFDSIARTRVKMGASFTTWRALTNVNNLQSDPGTAFDYAAPLAQLNEQDVTAKFAKLGFGYTVTQDAIDMAQGLANARAIAVQNAMNQFKIGADRKLLGGQNFALNTPGTPSVTASSTGGTIAASTAVNVKVAARTLSNYYYGGSTVASAQGSVTTGTTVGTNSASATVTAVTGAVAYDWFVAGFYYTTTTVNKVTITSIPTANQAVPNLPGLYGTAPSSVPASDSSAKSTDFNGLLATLAGDYATGGATGLVTRGSGTNSGAYFNSLDGSQFTVSGQNIAELDALNASLFNQIQTTPTRYLVSSQEANSIAKLIFSQAGGGTNYFAGTDKNRNDVVAGGFIGHYINKAAGGVPVPFQVMPNLAPGTLIAVTDALPFPSSNVSSTLQFRTLHDVQDWEYPAARNSGAGGGPRFDGEVFASGTLTNAAPVACGVLSNVAAS
jgi:hypothetical protein